MIDALVAIGGIIAAIAGALVWGRRQGRKAEREDRAEKEEKADAKTNESIDAGMARAGDGDWRSRLRRHRGE